MAISKMRKTTYGKDTSTAEKDAKNDVLTDTEKESWTIKQVFKWE